MNTALTRILLPLVSVWLCAFQAAAQAPVIDSFSPTSGYIGTSVRINGSNFSPTPADNIVFFGAVRASVTSASPDALVVSAPAGASYQPITVTVAGLTAAARTPFRLTFPGTEQVQLDGHSSFGTSDSFPDPATLLIGSLTGDGKLDMAEVGTFGNPSRAGLLLFKNTSTPGVIGPSSFASVVLFDLTITPGDSLSPGGVAFADLDGDGKPELLITDYNHAVLLIYRNISTAGTLEAASFSSPVSITWPGFTAMRHALAVADFDGDGRPDIALATSGGLAVLRNVSSPGNLTSSSFAPPFTVFTNSTAIFVTVADLDLDGKPDLALVRTGGAALLRNTSTGPGIGVGTFASPAFLNFSPGQQPTAILVGDMDCDGKLDLVVPHYGSGISGTTILRNLTSGPGLSADSFGQRIEFSGPYNATPVTFAISDFNGDGKLDLVTLALPVDFHQPSSISVLLNHCSAGSFTTNSFAPAVELALTDTSVQGGLSLADIDGDGRTDIVISRQNSSGTTSPKAYLTVYHNATPEPMSILPTVQIDSPTDGAIFTTGEDVAITANASDSDGSISRVSFFSGTNLLGSVTNAPYTILWSNVQLGNYVLRAKAFDNLGDFTTSDPIVIRVVPGAAPVIESFSPLSGPIGTAVSITGSNFNSIAANNVVYFGGVRGVVTAATSTNLIVTVPAGATYQPITVTTRGLSCAAKVPFIVTFIGAQQVRFETGVDYSTESGNVLRETLLTADLDGDGRLDLSCITQPGNFAGGLALFRNRSTPGALDQTSFERLGQIPTLFPQMNLTPNTAVIADLDGDGNLDLVMTEAGVVGIYRNLGTEANLNNGSFAGPVAITMPNMLAALHGLAVGDLDGDGHPDIVVCNYGGVSVLRNRASPGTIESNSFEMPLTVFTNSTPFVVVIADMDQDGKPDLVLVADTKVTVLRNVSTGPGSTNLAFGNPVLLSFPQGQQPINLTIGDMDGDGRPDIIAHGAGVSSCSTAIFRNLTSGPGLSSSSFAPGVQIAGPFTGDQGMATVADLNGDGKLDLVVLTPRFGSDSTVSAFINQGSPGSFNAGSLAFPVEIMVPSNYPSTWVALADVDGDAKTDIVVARRTSNGGFFPQGYLTVYRNSTPLPANLPPTISIASPTGGTTYTAPAIIPIAATAADSDGSIAQVSFFSGAALLGTITNTPYTFTWTNVPSGTYILTAKATDNLGAITTSGGVTVKVNPVPVAPTISLQPQNRSVEVGSNASFSVTASGTSPLSYQWLFNGNMLSGANASNLVFSSVQFSNAGQYMVIITNIAGSITSSPAVMTVTPTGGRLVHVLDTSGSPGTSVAVPIQLLGQGNENAVSFSITFPSGVLAYASAATGSGATGAVLNVNDSDAALGHLGISLALSADHSLAPGTQELVVVTFNIAPGIGNTTAAISFGTQPLSPEISDTLANVLTASYLNGSVAVVGGGYEGDVTPLPDGNGTVTVTDWIKIGRYAARLDTVPSSSQFQRADCAPRSTLGNGAITTTDWVQAGRYAAGLDPLTPAGGPTGSGSGFATPKGIQAKLAASPTTTRDVRIPKTGLRAGQTNIIPVLLVALGNESALGFSLNFDPALLTLVSANTGANAAGAVLNVNTSQAASGQIGMVMTLPIGTGTNTFPAGTQEVALIRFVVASNAIGATAVLFGDHPAATEVSDSLANSLAANFVSGALQVEPALKITRAGPSNQISWPTWASNAVLETTAALPALPQWQPPSTSSTNIAAGEIRVSVPLTPTQAFFRLRFP